MAELLSVIRRTTLSYVSWISNDIIFVDIRCLSSELQPEKKLHFPCVFFNIACML